MIVAFDGNVFVGKSTLVDYVAGKIKCRRIAEYAFFINKIKKEREYQPALSEHLKYLQVDRLRMKMIGGGINLLDRSFVSLSAHIYALYSSSGTDLREKHLQILRGFLRQKKIIIPDLYVFVSCGWEVAKKRFLTDRRDGGRGTPDLFMERKYFFAVEKFNLLWQKGSLSGCVIKPRGISRRRLVETIIIFAKKKNRKMSPTEIIDLTEKIFFNTY